MPAKCTAVRTFQPRLGIDIVIQILQEPGRTQFDLRWRMLGVAVRVHPGFWIVALLFAYRDRVPMTWVLLGVGLGFLAIIIHEFGHALAHRHFGDTSAYVVLSYMFGLCISHHALPPRPRIMTLLWGPGAGFLAGIPTYIAGYIIYRESWGLFGPIPFVENQTLYFALSYFAVINLIWGLVNLVPVFPLDGGQILREWINWRKPHRGDELAFTISMYAAIVVAAIMVGLFLMHYVALNAPLMFGILAGYSWYIRKVFRDHGSSMGREDSAPRQPWEQDADWWKKG